MANRAEDIQRIENTLIGLAEKKAGFVSVRAAIALGALHEMDNAKATMLSIAQAIDAILSGSSK